MACQHLSLDNSCMVVIHPHKLIHWPPMMAGHLSEKRCKLAIFEGSFCSQLLDPLPIKGGADFSAQIKGQTQVYAAKISAPNSSSRSLKTVPKSHQKPSEIRVKSTLLCNRICVCARADFVQFFLLFQPKSVGYWGVKPKKKIWVLASNLRAFTRVLPRYSKSDEISVRNRGGEFWNFAALNPWVRAWNCSENPSLEGWEV